MSISDLRNISIGLLIALILAYFIFGLSSIPAITGGLISAFFLTSALSYESGKTTLGRVFTFLGILFVLTALLGLQLPFSINIG